MKRTLAVASAVLMVLVFAVPISGITDGESRIIQAIRECCGSILPTGSSTSANQTAVQANPGSDASKAVAVQGVTGGKAVSVKLAGAPNSPTSQVSASITAGTLAVARATRRELTIKNLDSSITVTVGPATVTGANGMPIKAGESITVTGVGLWQVIAVSGTPTVAILDEYD